MAIHDRVTGKYKCSYCNKVFDQYQEADSCRDAHGLIYVQLSKQDLNRLIMFLTTKDESLLTKTLVDSLYKYRRIRMDD